MSLVEDVQARAYATIAEGSRSFAAASRLLAPDVRDDVVKLYALAHARQIGLYHDWGVARPLTNGYPGVRHKSFVDPRDAYRYVHDRPWPDDGDPLVVCHPDGWAALVDPSGDVAAQIVAGAPRPGAPVVQPEPAAQSDAVTVVHEGRTVTRELDDWLATELDRLGLLP